MKQFVEVFNQRTNKNQLVAFSAIESVEATAENEICIHVRDKPSVLTITYDYEGFRDFALDSRVVTAESMED